MRHCSSRVGRVYGSAIWKRSGVGLFFSGGFPKKRDETAKLHVGRDGL